MKRRTLVSWVGATDLASMAKDVGGAIQEQVVQAIKRPIRESDLGGPIKTLLRHEQFDQIWLLNNYHQFLEEAFVDWLGVEAKFAQIEEIKSPTDYASIYLAVDKFLGELFSDTNTRPTDFCIFLTPGTPAMAASWVLIGKSKYSPTFYQAYKDECSVTEIPFDISLHIRDVIGKTDSAYELMRGANPEEFEAFAEMVGQSDSMKEVIGRAKRIAIRDVPVLILGESGTGKTRIAEAIHNASVRKGNKFATVNCAAMPADLLESELFGHVEGSFTGASKDKAGLFETTDGGTLFLDEIGECPLDLQAKLLSVLQPLTGKGPSVRKLRRVGGDKESEVDVRVIAATNRNLVDLVNEKKFREDLFYRLAAITLRLPPIRERGEDIVRIANTLLTQINDQFQQGDPNYIPKSLNEDAEQFVRNQRWPGNVRQVYNALLQAAVLNADAEISDSDLASSLAEIPGQESSSILDRTVEDGFDLNDVIAELRRHYIQKALSKSGGSAPQAATLLGYATSQTLRNHMKELGIKP